MLGLKTCTTNTQLRFSLRGFLLYSSPVREGVESPRGRGYLSHQHSHPGSLPSRDEEDAARPEKDQPSPSAGKISSPFLQMAQDPTVPTYKQGILARKMHHDADGKKSECLVPGNKGVCRESST